jgi:hypothetical protein
MYVETCHNDEQPQGGDCLIDGKIRCVTSGWRRRYAAFSGTRLDAVD